MSLAESYRARPRIQFGKYKFLQNIDYDATVPPLNCCHGAHNSSADSSRGKSTEEELKPIAQLYTKAFGSDDMDGGLGNDILSVPELLENNNFDYTSHGNKNEGVLKSNSRLKSTCGEVISDEELLVSLGSSNTILKGAQQTQKQRPPAYFHKTANEKSRIFTLDEYTAAHLGWACGGGRTVKSTSLNISRMCVDMTEEAVVALESLKYMGRLSYTYLVDIYQGRWKRHVIDQAQRCGHLSYPMCNRGNMLSTEDANSFIIKLVEMGFLMSEELIGRYKNKCRYLLITDSGRDFADRKIRCQVIVEMSGKKSSHRKRPAEKQMNDLMTGNGQNVNTKLELNMAANVPNQTKLNPAYFPADK